MSELGERMALILSSFAATVPARVTTRDLKPFEQRSDAELVAGIYTLVSVGEGDYANYNGREMQDGRQRMLLIGQIKVAENATPSAVEDAEFALRDEVKAFVRALPAPLCTLLVTGFRQSAQAEHPYGWIAFDLEFLQ